VEYVLRFANISVLFFLVPAVLLFAGLRIWWYKRTTYRYSLGSELKAHRFVSTHKHRSVFFLLRFFLLFGLALSMGRPQFVDPKSNVLVEGIDMMVVLDVSGSMAAQDYGAESISRIEAAKQEAIRFIEKRVHDPIGLVIFGNDAVSRCPITADKDILISIVKELQIGSIDHRGTVLSIAMLTAANRLKDSKSKNKIMIVLTDGEPTPGDVDPEKAAEVAKRMGIKIYTIGIGSTEGKVVHHPLWGRVVQRAGVNKKLLTEIAQKTGGKFFLAENQNDMRAVYDAIDSLETTEYETDIFSRYYELFSFIAWVLLAFLFLEILLSSLIWFGI